TAESDTRTYIQSMKLTRSTAPNMRSNVAPPRPTSERRNRPNSDSRTTSREQTGHDLEKVLVAGIVSRTSPARCNRHLFAWSIPMPSTQAERSKRWRKAHPDTVRAYGRRDRRNRRIRALKILSCAEPHCACCGCVQIAG